MRLAYFLPFLLLPLICNPAYSQTFPPNPTSNKSQGKVYVWLFQSNLPDQTLAEQISDEFETALQETGSYKLVERRSLGRLLSRRKNEVDDMANLGSADAQLLKGQGATAVFFGNIFNDVESGQVKITVTLESFDSSILYKKAVLMKPFELHDVETRMKKFKLLLNVPTRQSGTEDFNHAPSAQQGETLSHHLEGVWRTTLLGAPIRIKITLKGNRYEGTMIVDNTYLPAGVTAIEGRYDGSSEDFRGLQWCAQPGYRNPYTVEANFHFLSTDEISERLIPAGRCLGFPLKWRKE